MKAIKMCSILEDFPELLIQNE